MKGLDPNEALKMTAAIAKGATIAQVPVEELTKTVAGMTTAFGRPQNLAEFNKFMAGFFTLTSEAPGGIQAGPQFVQALPQLAATARLANITPEQMFGTYLTGLRTAGTPATVGRGQQFMWQSLAVPASDEAEKALRGAGITSQSVQQRGGAWALGRLITHAKSLGVTGAAEADKIKFTDEQMNMLETLPPEAIGGTLGISGKGAEFLSTAMGRIHAVRQVIAIMSQEGGAVAGQDIGKMNTNMNNASAGAKVVGDQFKKFADQNPLLAMQMAMDNTRRQMMTALQPVIDPAAKGIARLGSRIAEEQLEHPERTRHRIQGAMIGGAGLALLKLLRPGAFGGVGRLSGRATWHGRSSICD